MVLLPHTFIFGISESDLQTVGSTDPERFEHAQKTMWDTFADDRGIDAPGAGAHKYTELTTDVRLLTRLGIKGYRTSVSMSRILDESGHVNKKAIAWYRKYLQALKSKGLDIHLCLYHWDAPARFSGQGVLDPSFPEYFFKHVTVVLENFSDLVDYFIPINELWCICYLSYFLGVHAPAHTDTVEFFQAYFRMVDLQTKVIYAIKKKSVKQKIGIVNIHFSTYIETAFNTNPSYIEARHIADALTNYLYSDPLFMGTIDEKIESKFSKIFPGNYKKILRDARLGDAIDYYGINYYNSQYVKPTRVFPGYTWYTPDGALTNSLGWPIALPPHYPNGLTDILVSYSQRYSGFGLKRLFITENGTPVYTKNVKGVINDDDRIFFIFEHVKQIEKAIAKGVNVGGYFLWTLCDNYEWQEGYRPESAFGLVAVDAKTGKRTPKKSYFWYQKLLKDFYKHDI